MVSSGVRVRIVHAEEDCGHADGSIGTVGAVSPNGYTCLVYVDGDANWQSVWNVEVLDEVIIPRSRLERLEADSRKWYALQAAGVDNWSGYDYAMQIVEEWNG